MATDTKEMTDEEIRARILQLGFDGDQLLFKRFCDELQSALPKGTGIALRGSVVTNERWADGEGFDADGKGTSDLDVTLIGDDAMSYWKAEEFYIPKLHTKPLCDEHPELAPGLDALRRSLQQMVGRPVNFQATSNFVLFVRDVILDQPYFTLIEPNGNA